jgi:hypothetical protein
MVVQRQAGWPQNKKAAVCRPKKFSLFRRCFHLFSSIPAVEEGE